MIGQCHISEESRGSAHERFNLNFTYSYEVSVVFHNSQVYNSHFVMQEVVQIGMDINIIPLSITLGNHLKFVDRFQFLSASLEKLTANLHIKLSFVGRKTCFKNYRCYRNTTNTKNWISKNRFQNIII